MKIVYLVTTVHAARKIKIIRTKVLERETSKKNNIPYWLQFKCVFGVSWRLQSKIEKATFYQKNRVERSVDQDKEQKFKNVNLFYEKVKKLSSEETNFGYGRFGGVTVFFRIFTVALGYFRLL